MRFSELFTEFGTFIYDSLDDIIPKNPEINFDCYFFRNFSKTKLEFKYELFPKVLLTKKLISCDA